MVFYGYFSQNLLKRNFGDDFDCATIHMTQVFGLLCIYSVLPSFMVYNDDSENINIKKRNVIISKLIFEVILLILMITANLNENNKILESHLSFGIFGLSLCILINSISLIYFEFLINNPE